MAQYWKAVWGIRRRVAVPLAPPRRARISCQLTTARPVNGIQECYNWVGIVLLTAARYPAYSIMQEANSMSEDAVPLSGSMEADNQEPLIVIASNRGPYSFNSHP